MLPSPSSCAVLPQAAVASVLRGAGGTPGGIATLSSGVLKLAAAGCSFLAALFGFAPVIVTFSLISATFVCELSPALGVDGRDGPSCGLVSLEKVTLLFVAAGSGDGFTRGVGRFFASTLSTGDASELPPPVFHAFGVPLQAFGLKAP